MKKTLLALFAIVSISFSMSAQRVADNALGVRIGDNDGFSTELNYQRALNEDNRLEFGLAWRSNDDISAFKLTGLYQWVWLIDGGFNWYAGVGGGVGQVDFDDDFPGDPDSETFLFAAGDIGIEYNFDIPLLLSLDFRPEFGFGDYRDDLDFDIALGIRYQF